MLRDPVCGRRINRRRAHIAIEYEKVIYYLCCPRCQAEFEVAPDRYARPELGEKARSKPGRRGQRAVPHRLTGKKGSGGQ
ncbi:MAG TPA: YHS domain-containing protein [Anaerolineae bacterium]|nr:YHS domain-containing protein [Anaerolineae bacterium]